MMLGFVYYILYGVGTLPSGCYILSDESFYSSSNGYEHKKSTHLRSVEQFQEVLKQIAHLKWLLQKIYFKKKIFKSFAICGR